jgi:hypothetical protein
MKLEFFLLILEKNIRITYFMKIRPVGTELFHTDRQTKRQDRNTDRHTDGQTDRNDGASSCILQFFDRA